MIASKCQMNSFFVQFFASMNLQPLNSFHHLQEGRFKARKYVMFSEHRGRGQAVYHCIDCSCAIKHARFMCTTSVRSADQLRCRFGQDQQSCRAQRRMGHSTWERTAMHNLCTWPPFQAGSYDLVISETCLWASADTCSQLKNCRLDFLVCTEQQAKARDFTDSVCLFIDGQHHFDWNAEGNAENWTRPTNWLTPAAQRDMDELITKAAVALGYCVVRVCCKDASNFLSIVRAAWQKRKMAIALVSKHWNTGVRTNHGVS